MNVKVLFDKLNIIDGVKDDFTVKVTLDEDVFSVTDEVVGGVLTDEWAEIPSYNGETITEPWLSSMDEYAPGATPTTGAQVVYKLATPITYQLTAQEVKTLFGQNCIWSDSGGVSVDYIADTKKYIDNKILQAIAAALNA